MHDIVSSVRHIFHLDAWLLLLVGIIVIANIYSIAVRRTLFRLSGVVGGRWLAVMRRIAFYAVIPSFVGGCVAVYLLPMLMHGRNVLGLEIFLYGILPVLRLAMIPAGIIAILVTVPYTRKLICRNPSVVESMSAVSSFVFFAHHAVYSGLSGIDRIAAGCLFYCFYCSLNWNTVNSI